MTQFTPKYIARQHKLLDGRKNYDPRAAKYLEVLAEIERLQEIERQAIKQSDHIQQAGLTDVEVAGLRAENALLKNLLYYCATDVASFADIDRAVEFLGEYRPPEVVRHDD